MAAQMNRASASINDEELPEYSTSHSTPDVGKVTYHHSNAVIEAAKLRAIDEQEMQQMLVNIQSRYKIYNSDIEPEHGADFGCDCPIHRYKTKKRDRYDVQDIWAKAVMYPGEKAYNDNPYQAALFAGNPYRTRVVSPFGIGTQAMFGAFSRPIPSWHAKAIRQIVDMNSAYNKEAQTKADANEPRYNIWTVGSMESAMPNLQIGRQKSVASQGASTADQPLRLVGRDAGAQSLASSSSKSSRFSSLRKSISLRSSNTKAVQQVDTLRDEIVAEETSRWPDEQWRSIVDTYQEKISMKERIADLRTTRPIQYLHLLRAGYFEPIPVEWAGSWSNPLKFKIDAAAGWRGITPAWRGYEDTAEERLYWVLNHRTGSRDDSTSTRLKPDVIATLRMARERMAKAVEPPPAYFSANDTCHLQHTSKGYSKQVMPSPFRPVDGMESPSDDTMILLDVSQSMDFDPGRPVYDQYTITRWERGTQPRNKDVAKSIIRRFCEAMANRDHQFEGYDLATFSSFGEYIGTVNYRNIEEIWQGVRFGGGTRVMTGWQLVKELHFEKHSQSAIHHPVLGWQAGPETPILRLLLLLDGEATDMDEFELDLLGLSWAHVTIFLIGVDGCPHHHRHANELQRISDVNHHVSFIDAQGNCPERFVTHELLKRHLGYDLSMQEFEQLEVLPAYTEVVS